MTEGQYKISGVNYSSGKWIDEGHNIDSQSILCISLTWVLWRRGASGEMTDAHETTLNGIQRLLVCCLWGPFSGAVPTPKWVQLGLCAQLGAKESIARRSSWNSWCLGWRWREELSVREHLAGRTGVHVISNLYGWLMVNHHIIKELTNVSKVHAIDCFCQMGWRHQPSPFVWLQQLLVTNTVHNLTGRCHLQSCWTLGDEAAPGTTILETPKEKGKEPCSNYFRRPSCVQWIRTGTHPQLVQQLVDGRGISAATSGPSQVTTALPSSVRFPMVPSGSQHPLMGSSPTWGWRPSAAALPCFSCPSCCLAKLRCPGNPGHNLNL